MSTSKQEWQDATLSRVTQRFGERRDAFETDSGLSLDTVYTPEDDGAGDYHQSIGYPGEFPYTRGVQPNMYRGRVWTMRQYAGYATAAATNERYRYLLENGQTGLSVAFDLPTQIGYDSDHPLAEGEVGKVGVPICSLADMETLFDGIPLDKVSTSMTINATAAVLLCLYIAAGKRQGVEPAQLSGTLQNDILKEYIARGTYAYPPRPSMRLVVDVFKYCAENVPRWNTISISGYHMREAGATATQELAFTFANAIAYVEAAVAAGLPVDDFAPRLSFFFVAQNNCLRKSPSSAPPAAVGQNHARPFRGQESALHDAAVPHPNGRRYPDGAAAGQQRNPQHGTGVGRRAGRHAIPARQLTGRGVEPAHGGIGATVPAHPANPGPRERGRRRGGPLGGSWYVENLTDRLEAGVVEYIERIDRMGGAVAAIEDGFQVREIGEAAFAHQRSVDDNQRIVVGVNQYVTESPPIADLLRVDAAAAAEQVERLKNLRRERDNMAVQISLARLADAARSEDANTIPPMMECVEKYATLGEICDVLRQVFGEYEPSAGL